MKRGCYWCDFREGLECKNPKKKERNGIEWNLGVSLECRHLEVHEEILAIPLAVLFPHEYQEPYAFFGYLCLEFKPTTKRKEVVVFS